MIIYYIYIYNKAVCILPLIDCVGEVLLILIFIIITDLKNAYKITKN